MPIADSWGRPLLYAIFGGSFVFFLLVVIRMVSRKREAERLHDPEHEPAVTQVARPNPQSRVW